MELIDKSVLYIGGVFGGFALVQAPTPGILSALNPVLDVVGAVAMIVFAGGLIVRAARSFTLK
ncbi:hypothetical protein [Paenibacillus xerothermodurans]|uniref:hypothetical protein n=1 Tax=Paenibacillus xerothermodurans TaxID=1977292 RepID=UPI0010577798|nr:hypothetical protein [Paenibacillus xerothermodurans]